MGFDEPQKREPMPKYVHNRNGFFLAKFDKGGGTNGYNKCKTIEDAVTFLSTDPSEHAGDACKGEEVSPSELPDDGAPAGSEPGHG